MIQAEILNMSTSKNKKDKEIIKKRTLKFNGYDPLLQIFSIHYMYIKQTYFSLLFPVPTWSWCLLPPRLQTSNLTMPSLKNYWSFFVVFLRSWRALAHRHLYIQVLNTTAVIVWYIW